MTAANLLAYAAQVTIIVLACAGLPRLLRLRSPVVQYAFWRTTLAVCLLLPFVQPWKPAAMTFVPAPIQGAENVGRPAKPAPPPATRRLRPNSAVARRGWASTATKSCASWACRATRSATCGNARCWERRAG